MLLDTALSFLKGALLEDMPGPLDMMLYSCQTMLNVIFNVAKFCTEAIRQNTTELHLCNEE